MLRLSTAYWRHWPNLHKCRSARITLQLIVGIMLLQVPVGSSIWCYQCFTSDPKDLCATSPPSALEDCQESFCLKTVIYYPNGSLMSLSRTCTSIELPSYCSSGQMEADDAPFQHTNYRPIEAKKRDIKLCTYFCASNYCNAGDSRTNGTISLPLLMTGLWLYCQAIYQRFF